MNDLDREEERVLTRARAALSPSSEDARRVLEATLHAAHSPAVLAPSKADVRATSAATMGGASKALVVVAIAALSGGYGYWLGFDAGRGAAELAARPQRAAVAPPVAPRRAAPAPELMPGVAAAPPPSPTPALTHEARGARLRRAPAEPSAAAARAPSLSEELDVLKRVERALRAGEPGLALELLDDLEQRQPTPALAEERSAASVAARCALGLGSRRSLVENFAYAYSDSVYLARVREACEQP